MMPKYINAKAFEKSVYDRYCKSCRDQKKDSNGVGCNACWVNDMLGEIEDAPDIVRCAQCKYNPCREGYVMCSLHGGMWEQEGFCSDGEEMDNASDDG